MKNEESSFLLDMVCLDFRILLDNVKATQTAIRFATKIRGGSGSELTASEFFLWFFGLLPLTIKYKHRKTLTYNTLTPKPTLQVTQQPPDAKESN